MPTKYQTNFNELTQKCPSDYYERLRTPGCLLTNKPFEPMRKGKAVTTTVNNIASAPTQSVNNTTLYVPPTIEESNFQDYLATNSLLEPNSSIPQVFDYIFDEAKLYSGSSGVVNTTKRIMKTYHEQLNKENPKMTTHDRIMAEMAAGAYIHNDQQLDNYINETSNIKEAGYTLDKELTAKSKGLMLVFVKDGKPTIAFRGTEVWIGQDGLSNFTNATGITRVSQAVTRATGMSNPVLKDQATIDSLMNELYEKYQQVPEDFTGHSLGGARAKLARLFFRKNYKSEFTSMSEHKVTGFMAAPGGGSKIHADDGAYKLYATEAFDPVALVDRLQMAITGTKGVVNVFGSTHGYGILGSHNVENVTGNVRISDAKPGAAAVEKVPLEDTLELKKGVFTEKFEASAKATLKELPRQGTGFATSVLAGGITKTMGLESGSQTEILATSSVNTALDSAVVGAAQGTKAVMSGVAMSRAASLALSTSATAAAEMALPMLAAYEAATTVGQLVDRATGNWTDRGAAGALSGGAAGASGALAALGTSTAIGTGVNLFNAARTAASGYSLLAAGEETAAELALVPIPGFRLVAGAVAIGTLVGVGFGWLFHSEDTEEEKQQKALEQQHAIESKFNEIKDKFNKAYSNHPLNLDSLQASLLDPTSVLTQQEVEFMNNYSDGKFFESYTTNITQIHQDERRAQQFITSINERRAMDPFFKESRLSAGEMEYLHARRPEFLQEIRSTYETNMENATKEARNLGIPVEEMIDLIGSHARDGLTDPQYSISDDEYLQRLDTYAADAMHLTPQQVNDLRNAEDDDSRDEMYNTFVEERATTAGFETAQEYLDSFDDENNND